MAKNTQPVLKRCKTLGLSLRYLVTPSLPSASPSSPPQAVRVRYAADGEAEGKIHLRRAREAVPCLLRETRYLRVEILLQELERRLDNVVFRMGFANTRREARQLVNHAHFTVNGKRVNIPSYQVKPGDVVAVREKSRSTTKFKTLLEENGKKACPKWIDKAKDSFEGKIVAMPARDDIDYDVSEHLIVELYSK